MKIGWVIAMNVKKKVLSNKKVYDIVSYLYRIIGLNKIRANGNKVDLNGTKLKKTNIIINGINNNVHIGRKSLLKNCTIVISGSNCSVQIGAASIMNDITLVVEDDGGSIIIGNEVIMMGNSHIATTEGKSISIGNQCMFAESVTIRSGDSHAIIDVETKSRINYGKDVHIGNHVWIGNNAMVLKGVVVDSNSIIGAGAVVTSDVPNNVIVAGNPARIVKKNVEWRHER